MNAAETSTQGVSRLARSSYLFMLGLLVLVAWQHLGTLLLAACFSYLALTKLHFMKRRGKWVAVALFLILLLVIAYGLGYLINQTVQTLPSIAERATTEVISLAKQHQIELPFTDYESLKDAVSDTVTREVRYLGSIARFARGATTQFVFLVVGCVVAISIFFSPVFELNREAHLRADNLYSALCAEVAERFRTFYRSFATVIGAQIIISAINTVLTAIFVLAFQLPHAPVVVGATFLCGLLPVVGNLVSNTIVVGIGFTVSLQMAVLALVFLVLIHKLEYFLNSKIIGLRIHNPLWLTLLGLVIGEKLMGLPGMILAPVVLNYLKLEMSAIKANP